MSDGGLSRWGLRVDSGWSDRSRTGVSRHAQPRRDAARRLVSVLTTSVLLAAAAATADLHAQVVVTPSSQPAPQPSAQPAPQSESQSTPARTTVQIVGPDGTTRSVEVPIGPDGKPIMFPGRGPFDPNAKPGEPPRPGDAPKPGDSPQPAAAPMVITRPTAPPTQPNRDELRVKLDPNGKVRFNFRGQPWLDVVTWLAAISQMSLDWQELPGDYLNLTTQRSYSVEEARDLINRHLLARGFTLLVNGEVLNVVNLKKLDSGLVPRIGPEELLQRMPHEFVKVSFPLQSLLAESAVEELKPMLSPHGTIVALKSTNRVEAMDAVINLRSLYKVLGEEQSDEGQERSVREFELEFAKATEVQQQLQKLLGLDEPSGSRGSSGRDGRGMSPEQMQQMMMQQQQMEMMQREGRGRGGMPMMASQKPEIHLVVNARRNSILAHAAPDKMAIITQAVKMLDVPPDNIQTLTGSLQRMQVYRLAALDPAVVVRLLEESGGLEPTTRVQVDEKNRAIVVHGSLADQITIRAVIEKLDGSGRQFHVIPLRRLEADYVAGTIEFMMLGGGEENQQEPRRRYFDFFDRGSRDREENNRDKLRVDADIENNRLLVWANDVEIEEVLNLLEKLGEITEPARRGGGNGVWSGGDSGSTTRVLSIEPGKDPREVLERIRQLWPQLSPNPLLVPDLPGPRSPSSSADEKTTPTTKPQTAPPAAPQAAPPADPPPPAGSVRDARMPQRWQPYIRAAQLSQPGTDQGMNGGGEEGADQSPRKPSDTEPQTPAADAPASGDALRSADAIPADGPAVDVPSAAPGGVVRQAQPALAPVRIGVTPDGRLVLSSADTVALDQLEQLIGEIAAPRKDYHVFHLKHARAYWVKMNIEEFFEEKEQDSSSSRTRNYFFFDGPPPSKNEPRRRLSKRKALKFVTDPDTNTLLVSGADAAQLKIIEELIELYDQPEPVDPKSARVTTMYKVRWSTANVLAEAVKDVYRDLLSVNDKALGTPAEDRARSTGTTFKGKLSIGIDEVSNTLLVSADGEALSSAVLKMISDLDEAAKPSSTIQVLKVEGATSSESVRKALREILERESGGKAKQPGSPSAPQQPPMPQEDSRRSFDRGRSR